MLFAILLSFLVPPHAKNREALTARDYYNEVYAAGGLDDVANGHACFQDDPKVDSFFILEEGSDHGDSRVDNGTSSTLPETPQEPIRKDILTVRGYAKGIPWKGQEFLEKDEESWISDLHMLDEHTPIRIRFNIDWQTLRYKYAVEVLNMDSTYRTEVASFGHCEEVPVEVPKHGED